MGGAGAYAAENYDLWRNLLMAFTLTINGTDHEIDVEPETPLLWVLRDTVGLSSVRRAADAVAGGDHLLDLGRRDDIGECPEAPLRFVD